jgi:ParB-like chromosome segregation protein Spo0J
MARSKASEIRFVADKIERWPIDDLKPYDRNARVHSAEQVEQIARSMRENGFTIPILVAEDGEIIAGHGREQAARRLGLQEVPVMVARGWTDEQTRAYRLQDNAIALNSTWDDALLKIEIGDLKAEEFDVSALGFSAADLDRLLAAAPAPEAPVEFPEHDEAIETEHCCPKCGYKWSGKSS